MSEAATFDGVVKDYRQGVSRRNVARALDGLSFEVPRGGITALLGPNGAGKSTAPHLLMGFLVPTQGSVRVLDKPPTDPVARRPEGASQLPIMTMSVTRFHSPTVTGMMG